MQSPKLLSHARLDVYQRSIEFLGFATRIIHGLPRGNADLADQLRRASLSVPLNIAEGVGKTTDPDKRKHFGIARGSALECSAILDACAVMQLIAPETAAVGTALLVRVVEMLSKICR